MKLFFILTAFTIFTAGYAESERKELNFNTPVEKFIGFNAPPLINTSNSSSGIDLSIYYLPFLTIGGAGQYLGSEVELFDMTTWEEDLPEDVIYDIRLDYGDKTAPVITGPAAEIPFELNIGYTFEDTRAGLSWFRVTASDEQSGEVPGYNLSTGPGTEEFGYGFVSFWNMGWDLHASRGFPATWAEGFRDLDENEDEDYLFEYFPDRGSSQWEASHDISFNSFQLTLQHPLIKNDNLSLSLTGGLQYGRWSDNLKQTLNITSHQELTDRWTEMVYDEAAEDSILVEVFQDYVYHNDITLETKSSSSFNSLGLLAGIEADWRVLPSLSFSLKADASTLTGDASFSGTGIDIDDIVESETFTLYDMEGNMYPFDPLEGYEYLSGEFDLPEYSESVRSVNYRLSISAGYEITGNITVMAGYSYSIWNNLPMSPQWSYMDAYTQPFGPFAVEDSWDTDRRSDIYASGFKLGIGFAF